MNQIMMRALLIGVSSGGFLMPVKGQEVLFGDTFNRPDNTDLNASSTGKSGSFGALDWSVKSNSGSPGIVGERLQLGETGAGGGWSIAWVDHNFTDSVIANLGEFTVSVDIANLGSSGNTRFNGFAIGNALADLTGWSVNLPASFASDFFIGYDPTGTTEVKIFVKGAQAYQQTINLNSGATLSVRFHGFSDFNAGTTVQYEAFINGGSPVKTGSFTWSGTNENYINLYSNYTGHTARLDNFKVSTLAQDDDSDGLPNWWEQLYFGSPTAADPGLDGPDQDGLTNLDEFLLGTNPTHPDTDGDGLLDGGSITVTSTDTRFADWAALGILFDDDGGNRTFLGEATIGTNPTSADTDGDGLADGVETNTGVWVSENDTGTDPLNPDSDADGLADGVETNTGLFVSRQNTGTNPNLPDTDGDGVGDWYEITASFTNPFDPEDKPNVPYPLPTHDGSPGTADKPVKVYIMSGQSNMVGEGTVSGTGDHTLETMTRRQNKFPNLIDENGDFIARQDVRYRGVISAIGNGPLAPGFGANSGFFGPELGFGQIMGWYHGEPVLLLKSCTGNRSLGWDVLPPGSVSYDYNGNNYPGYGLPIPATQGAWYAGKEFDRFFMHEDDWAHPDNAVTNVVDVLDNFATQYPAWASQGFEIAGFVWWQGDKDRYDMGLATRYEQNLVNLITSLRSYYENRYPGKVAANAPFVLATLGQTTLDSTNAAEKAILDAKLAVDGESGKYPEFAGNVKTVYAHPLSEGGASNGHYNQRAGTYLLVGDALGRAMVELQGTVTPPGDGYPAWSGGPFANELTDTDPALDFDGGSLPTGIEWVVGGDPTSGSDDAGLAPTLDTTSDPDGKLLFTFRRTAAAKNDANTAIAVQYGGNLAGWTNAVHQGTGADQITITTAPNGPDEIVTVALPPALAGDGKLFVRLNATILAE